jgi:hypothetical protein
VDSSSDLCVNVRLSEDKDSPTWALLTKSSIFFLVQSLYFALKATQVKWSHRKLWFFRVHLKVKVFIWLVC